NPVHLDRCPDHPSGYLLSQIIDGSPLRDLRAFVIHRHRPFERAAAAAMSAPCDAGSKRKGQRVAVSKVAPASCVVERSAPWRLAPARGAPRRSARPRAALETFAPMRIAPARLAFARLTA